MTEPEALSTLAELVGPADPPDGLFGAIDAEIDRLESAAVTTLRAGHGVWKLRRDKVWKKILHEDPATGRSIYLLRCEPGATIPEHVHERDEHAFVIEGELLMGDLHILAGDSQYSAAGTVHPDLHSPTGCLILVHL